MRWFIIFLARFNFRLACRALSRPYDSKASARLDRALAALEKARGIE